MSHFSFLRAQVSFFKRRNRTNGDYDSKLVFSPDGQHVGCLVFQFSFWWRFLFQLAFVFSPALTKDKCWLPRTSRAKLWTLDLYTVTWSNDVPLKRSHRVDGTNAVRLVSLSIKYVGASVLSKFFEENRISKFALVMFPMRCCYQLDVPNLAGCGIWIWFGQEGHRAPPPLF